MKISALFPFLLILVVSGSRAASILDLPGDEMLRQAAELRTRLNLTAAQAGPWLQAESKSREFLREQKARQERLQIELREEIARGQFSTENFAARIDSEDTVAQEERRHLRQLWVGVLRGLDDTQVRQLRDFLHQALDAAPTTPAMPQPQRDSSADEQPKQRGGHGGRGGIGSGMGGGMGGGMSRF